MSEFLLRQSHFSCLLLRVLGLLVLSGTAMFSHYREVWLVLMWGNLLGMSLWSRSVVRSIMRWCVWVTECLKHEVKVMSHKRVALALARALAPQAVDI